MAEKISYMNVLYPYLDYFQFIVMLMLQDFLDFVEGQSNSTKYNWTHKRKYIWRIPQPLNLEKK